MPTPITFVTGVQYDWTTDKLYMQVRSSGKLYMLPSASTRDWTTVATGDWVSLPQLGANTVPRGLALILD